MGRARRIHLPNTVVKVSQVCHNNERLFKNRRDKDAYLHVLREKTALLDYTVISYAVRDNKIKLILNTPDLIKDHTLSALMQRVNTAFGKRFNKRHHREGTVWKERFKDVWTPACSTQRLLKLIWTVERDTANGGKADPIPPELWEWCSAFWAFQLDEDPVGAVLLVVLTQLLQGKGMEMDPLQFLKELLESSHEEWAVEVGQAGPLWSPLDCKGVMDEAVEAAARASPRPPSWTMLVEAHARELLSGLSTVLTVSG